MKYLKKFNESVNEIDSFCYQYGIRNYTINPDGIVDVNGDVDISNKMLQEIPIQFGRVTGDFSCYENNLRNLRGAPNYIGGNFDCWDNKLTTLEGGPRIVKGYYGAFNNKLTNLIGSPNTVGGNFYVAQNELTTLQGAPNQVDEFDCCKNNLTTLEFSPTIVGGLYNCAYNKLTSLKGCPEIINGEFLCSGNDLSNLEFFPKVTKSVDLRNCWSLVDGDGIQDSQIDGELKLDRTPLYQIFLLFNTQNDFVESFQCDYIRGYRVIHVLFDQVCRDTKIEMPEIIPGYKWLW